LREKAAALEAAAAELLALLAARGLRIACAESCTGGLVTASITAIPGSSAALWGGIVSYSNECKEALLGVRPETLSAFGAVSREVAIEMALGTLAASSIAGGGADISLAITGIAGPDGGSAEKPVGTVWFAWRRRDGSGSEARALFPGNRKAVREAAALRALEGAAALAREGTGSSKP
jgi:nicotinamide-nucleotide amidase